MNRVSKFASCILLATAVGVAGCGEEFQEELPPRDAVYYPIGLEVHPNGRFLYVVNSNFDLRYRDDQGGTVSVIDTDSLEIRAASSPYLASFGGHIALNEDATKAYVTSREQDQIVVLSVAEQGQALYCDIDSTPSADTRPCTIRRVPDTRGGTQISSDPFGVAVERTTRTIGGVETELDVVHLSHLRGESVTSIAFPEGRVAGATMQSAALMQQGGNQLAIRPGTTDVFVAARNGDRIEGFRPFISHRGEVEAIVRRASIPIVRQGTRMDARGIAFDDSGDRMYVATRRPHALHVVDMSSTPRVLRSIPLERSPSELLFHRGADGIARLYIPSYRYGVIEVVEPARDAVVDLIEVGRSPYHLVADSPAVHCREPGQRCRAYVSLFDAGPDGQRRCDDDAETCGQIAVIDLDPASESFHTVVDTIE